LEATTLDFELGPTQSDFIFSDAEIVQLISGMGEGKTWAGTLALIVHAKRCGRRIRGAIIRDTFQNIKTSTMKDIQDYLGDLAKFSDQGRQLIIKSDPPVDVDLFGIDDPAAASKLQGPQYSIVWLEEPAPIYEKVNAGLPIEVFRMSVARAARQMKRDDPSFKMRVQLTHNPADEDHWTAMLAEEPEEYMNYTDPMDGVTYTIHKKVFRIPKGENRFLSPLSRAALMAAFKDDPAKWSRYVEGKEALVSKGRPVVPAYDPRRHFSDKVLPVARGEAMMFWDAWMHPAVLLCQWRAVDSFGEKQLVVHDVLYDEGIGTREILKEQVFPMLNTPKWKNKVTQWRIIGDPSMCSPDQTSSRSSPKRELEESFNTRFEPGPVAWEVRRETLNDCFKRSLNNGEPVVVLSRSATRLHRSLKGGWFYKTDKSGNATANTPDQKGPSAHPGNALSYGLSVLMPYKPRLMKRNEIYQVDKRIASYGVGGGRVWQPKPNMPMRPSPIQKPFDRG
jgi:hypothetical protein